jgi:hypothetical protein
MRETDAAAQTEAVMQRYDRFAVEEAPGRSELYAQWARGVASDAATAGILARIPEDRRQPALVFAVTRMLGAPEHDFEEWSRWLRRHADETVAEASARRVQTNEPQRCAVLLPALATVTGPVALLEIGASAGLCLYPDRYSYRYRDAEGEHALDPADGPSSVVLACETSGDPPLGLPRVVWRAGIELAPLDAGVEADRRFLTSLVWPGEQGRVERIEAALDIAASAPPLLWSGDAADPDVLRAAAARAPRDATLVITTPGVLPHIPRLGRERLIDTIRALDAVWISIDPPAPHATGSLSVGGEAWNGFVLARDGEPLAAVDPLGGFLHWRASRTAGADAAV